RSPKPIRTATATATATAAPLSSLFNPVIVHGSGRRSRSTGSRQNPLAGKIGQHHQIEINGSKQDPSSTKIPKQKLKKSGSITKSKSTAASKIPSVRSPMVTAMASIQRACNPAPNRVIPAASVRFGPHPLHVGLRRVSTHHVAGQQPIRRQQGETHPTSLAYPELQPQIGIHHGQHRILVVEQNGPPKSAVTPRAINTGQRPLIER
ncbi:hypothetical protein ACLOJK_019190, partial [Asimina triloba]